jgi:YVTN family beta-propeller protein
MIRLALFLLAAATATAAAAQSLSGTLLVANRDGGSISFFDLEAGVEMARLPVGPRIPHEIAISPDGRLALSSEYGTGDDRGRTLLVIDVPTASYLGRIDLGPDSRPHSFAFLPDGRRAVATMEDSDELALVDVVALTVIETFPTGGREGHMVRLSPDGGTAYVTSRGAEGTLSVIDLSGDRAPVVVETGPGAEGLAVSPDGREVWVVNRSAESISIVDTESLEVVDTIESPPFAGRAEISQAGRVLVPNGTSGQDLELYLTLYDLETREVTARHSVRPGEAGPGGFGIHIAGETAFVSDRAAREIAVYDLGQFPAAPRILTMGHDDPDGLGFSTLRLDVMGD